MSRHLCGLQLVSERQKTSLGILGDLALTWDRATSPTGGCTLVNKAKKYRAETKIVFGDLLSPSLCWVMPANTILSIFVEMVSKWAMSMSSHRV